MHTDLLLAERARKGDIAAFEEIVTTYEGRVYALALRSTGSTADAADITQEVFLRAWRGLSSFRGDSTLSTWLFRITNNLCVDKARRQSHQVTVPMEEDESNHLPEDREANLPEEAYEQNAVRQEIALAMAELSEEHRMIICLRDIDGFSYEEIARALSLEQGTVKSRLARGRSKLRDILLERGNIELPSASKKQKGGRKHV